MLYLNTSKKHQFSNQSIILISKISRTLTFLPLIQRLPVNYNFNHMFYYEKGDWSLYLCEDLPPHFKYPVYSISYYYQVYSQLKQIIPGLTTPWYWFSTGYHLNLNWVWHNYRHSMGYRSINIYIPILVVLLSHQFVVIFKNYILKYITIVILYFLISY